MSKRLGFLVSPVIASVVFILPLTAFATNSWAPLEFNQDVPGATAVTWDTPTNGL
jgi:hypothetical protein